MGCKGRIFKGKVKGRRDKVLRGKGADGDERA
jgi:hypothetical protein